jgi:hypothetical protein
VIAGVFLFVGVVAWVAVARSSLLHGDDMERTDRVPQLYGYTVCLIAIVVMLTNVGSIIDKVFTLSDPLASNAAYGWNGVVLSSFDAYRATVDRAPFPTPTGEASAPAAKPSDEELHRRYDALRADQIARVRLDARRELTSSIVLFVIALGLFLWHWRWVRAGRTVG